MPHSFWSLTPSLPSSSAPLPVSLFFLFTYITALLCFEHIHLLILLLVDTQSVVCLVQCHLSSPSHCEVYALECCSFTRPLLVKVKTVGIYSDPVSTLRNNVLTFNRYSPSSGTSYLCHEPYRITIELWIHLISFLISQTLYFDSFLAASFVVSSV